MLSCLLCVKEWNGAEKREFNLLECIKKGESDCPFSRQCWPYNRSQGEIGVDVKWKNSGEFSMCVTGKSYLGRKSQPCCINDPVMDGNIFRVEDRKWHEIWTSYTQKLMRLGEKNCKSFFYLLQTRDSWWEWIDFRVCLADRWSAIRRVWI